MRTTDTVPYSAKQFIAHGQALGFGQDDLLQAIAELYETGQQESTYPVIVDHGLSLAEMVKAGNYGYANSNINAKNFPVKETGKVKMNLELVHLNRNASTNEVLAHMESHGLRPATLPELLALGEKYPDLQRQFLIVALGSSWVRRDGRRHVAYLWDDDGERHLNLYWCEGGWLDSYRFLAVRK